MARRIDTRFTLMLALVLAALGVWMLGQGSTAISAAQSNFVGSVSGGCIEGAVVQEALDAIADGKPRLLNFGITNAQAWEVGLACGGKVEVFVDRLE